jgi:hypothetical protein
MEIQKVVSGVVPNLPAFNEEEVDSKQNQHQNEYSISKSMLFAIRSVIYMPKEVCNNHA